MTSPWLATAFFLLSSCGAYQWLGDKTVQNNRQIASIGAQQLLIDDQDGFNEMLQENLHSLHSYYLIGQKNLIKFDSDLGQVKLEKLYESDSYLNLIAVRSQAEEIEHELEEVWDMLGNSKDKKQISIQLKMKLAIQKYAEKSPYAALAMENLMHHLQIVSLPSARKNKFTSGRKEMAAEFKSMENSKEFAVYEKNIEHLSHMLDIKFDGEGKKFYPSSTKSGNITGNEFPSKVWSLTFDDGPGKATSLIILKNLKERNLKATFFQLTQHVKDLPEIAREIREAGMEIASHSYGHIQLTKVGAVTLEREITDATNDLGKLHGKEIKFYRLPYGAGLNSPQIRDKIAENKLIHVFWNIDTLDWMPQAPEKIVKRTLALMKKTPKDAGVLLFHDIHLRTTLATPEIMDYLKIDGRRVCTLDEIVTQINEDAETVCPSK
ncbi:MAG TPA: polysaccharide deacetylase family protein [Bacteriovoracaceae bacterium]|nr:polysaccharide deacetylase family protein [Bacteriovoracaceae bacterium]